SFRRKGSWRRLPADGCRPLFLTRPCHIGHPFSLATPPGCCLILGRNATAVESGRRAPSIRRQDLLKAPMVILDESLGNVSLRLRASAHAVGVVFTRAASR